MNVCIVAGARPNFIKVAPLARAIDKARTNGSDINSAIVYTGKEDDTMLEATLFDDLRIGKPDVFLGVDSENMNELTGMVMSAFDKYLRSTPTDVVIVVDDLASTMAAAIVTKKHGLTLAHLVAGTRSFDINMPKEINRLVTGGLSDLLFTAGTMSNGIAARDGGAISKRYMVGNILIDTLRFNHGHMERPKILDELGVSDGGYLVLTLNRKTLINGKNLRNMLDKLVDEADGTPIIAPLRGAAALVVSGYLNERGKQSLHVIPPLGYLQFCYLTARAKGIITDSGNIAEEATFNGVPCITLNSYTEHIETVKIGSNVLVGEDENKLGDAVKDIVAGRWKKCGIPESWDGHSAERIVKILLDYK